MTSIVEGKEFIVKSSENLTDIERIKQMMADGKDVYSGEQKFFPYDIDKINLPYLKEFVKKYPHFLRANDLNLK